jgi:hypothetical protein
VVLKCKKIKKCILPCENFNFVTKISRYFAKFRNISRYEISRNLKKLFREIRNKYFAKFRDREISSTTLLQMWGRPFGVKQPIVTGCTPHLRKCGVGRGPPVDVPKSGCCMGYRGQVTTSLILKICWHGQVQKMVHSLIKIRITNLYGCI